MEYSEFELIVPSSGSFLLRGTLPLVPGTYPRGDGQNPFAVLDYDGTPKACQVEIVSKYSNFAHDGADVVELIAQVRRDPNVSAGTRVKYDVVVGYTPQTVRPSSVAVDDLITGPVNVMNSVVGLISDPTSIEIATRDVFGHRYSMRPLEAQGGIELERYGDLHAQIRTYGTMLPDNPVSGTTGTLPHLMGVHAYISTQSNSHVVLVDLRINNAADGNDSGDPIDDANTRVYWDKLDLIVPTGWVVLTTFDNPYWGNIAPQIAGGRTTYQVVEPLAGADLHTMMEQGQFHRRLALCPAGFETRAQDLLELEGLGFCRRGVNRAGDPFFSWWNPNSSRYFPQSFMLPGLEHMGHASIRGTLNSELNTLVSRVRDGTGTGSYPIKSANLGWGHPYGVEYGGMTGGDEIQMYEGVRAAEAAAFKGVRALQLWHRMHQDRHPNALVQKNGDPTRLELWLQGTGNNKYTGFDFYMKLLGSSDPFGYKSAPKFQQNAVIAQNRNPFYEGDLIAFEAHDQQHLIRYTHAPKALIWLTNDALSKDDLEMQSEIFRLSYHMYGNNSPSNAQITGLKWDREYIDGNPGAGFRFGRGEGWGIDAATTAYATGDDALRQTFKPWLDDIRDVSVDGQASCSGFLQANISPQFVSGLYRARNNIEQAILETALRGMVETVYRGTDPASVVMLEDVLEKSYYSWFSTLSWSFSKKGPWSKAAVGPLDETLPPWCNVALPPNGTSGWVDTYQLWSSLAYANWMTGDPIFLQRSDDMLSGSSTLITKLENQGTNNIGNQAALLALVQYQNGDI